MFRILTNLLLTILLLSCSKNSVTPTEMPKPKLLIGLSLQQYKNTAPGLDGYLEGLDYAVRNGINIFGMSPEWNTLETNPNSYPLEDNDINLNIQEDKIIYISRYSSLIANFVIKAEFDNQANIHFVYSISKGVNGKIFNNPKDLLNFDDEDISNDNMAEIFYDSSFFIKYDFVLKK